MLRPGHELFQKPFAVAPQLEDTPAPENFEKWKPGFGKTVATFPIFTASDTKDGEPGLVTSDGGFEEFPDAERILGGINMKGPDYAAVARHGSFVMWGFHCRPESLTDAGRRLFLNSLAYAAAHKGAPVETLRLRPTRVDLDEALSIFLGLYPKEERLSMLQRHYAGEPLPPSLLDDEAARRSWLAERRPFLHPADDGANWDTAYQLTLDPQCKELGAANDSLAFLDALAARLAKDASDALSATLIARYVPGVAPADFSAWLAKNRDQLYFTEAGGWIWRVKGQRAKSPALRVANTSANDPVTIKAETTESTLTITLRVRSGWHVYSPAAKQGQPVRLRILEGSAFEATASPKFDDSDDGTLSGYTEIHVPIRRIAPGDALDVELTYMACDASTCLPMKTVRLTR